MTSRKQSTGRIALKGKLETSGELTDVIQMIFVSRWTGALHVLNDQARRTVFFKEGDVRAAASDAPSERLGEILCREGAISREQLEATLDRPQDQKRLGAALVQRKLITTHALYSFIRKQMEEIFFALLSVDRGEFYFHRRDLPGTLPAQLRLLTHELLLEGMERMAELARYRQLVPSFAVLFERTEQAEEGAKLGAAGRAVLALVDGASTLEDIAERAALGEFHATQAAHELLQAGLIRLAGAHRRTTEVHDRRRVMLALLIGEFNEIFAQFHLKAERDGQAGELHEATRSFFEEGTVHPALFRGATLGADGTLELDLLLDNLAKAEVSDQAGYLYEALDELLFFETFVVGETVGDTVERQLKARLEEVRSSITR